MNNKRKEVIGQFIGKIIIAILFCFFMAYAVASCIRVINGFPEDGDIVVAIAAALVLAYFGFILINFLIIKINRMSHIKCLKSLNKAHDLVKITRVTIANFAKDFKGQNNELFSNESKVDYSDALPASFITKEGETIEIKMDWTFDEVGRYGGYKRAIGFDQKCKLTFISKLTGKIIHKKTVKSLKSVDEKILVHRGFSGDTQRYALISVKKIKDIISSVIMGIERKIKK